MTTLLSINNYHYRRGGAESVYFDHAHMFEQQGWNSRFFAMSHPRNVACDDARFFVDEIEFGHDYSMLAKLSMAAKIVWSREARRKLGWLLDSGQVDIAHVHSVYHHISPAVIPLLQERGIPVVLTAHDLKLLCPAYTMLSNGEVCEACRGGHTWNVTRKRCIKGSTSLSALIGVEAFVHRTLDTYRSGVDRVVTPSRFYRDKFVEWGWPETQVIYVPNYIDVEQLTPQFAPGDYFLYFGRLVREKGVHTLIEAAAKAGVALRIAGTGPDESEFRALAESVSQQKDARIDFLGFCSGEDLYRQIREARAVVLPSEWYENAPISLLEAHASGTPVVGADIGGIPEMIGPGTGWTYPSGSVAELARLLTQVADMPESELEAMGEHARTHVAGAFNRRGYLDAMRTIYADLGVA